MRPSRRPRSAIDATLAPVNAIFSQVDALTS
jgi:hypothetical protein